MLRITAGRDWRSHVALLLCHRQGSRGQINALTVVTQRQSQTEVTEVQTIVMKLSVFTLTTYYVIICILSE